MPVSNATAAVFEALYPDAFVLQMKERALSLVTEALDTPVRRMAVIEVPDGNHITIHKRHG